MSRRSIGLDGALSDYLLSVSLREPPLLRRLREETATLGGPAGMQISPEQGQFMALMVKLTGARLILEIGTFTGYSALCMASALPPDGHLIACDVSAEWTAVARRYWTEAGLADRIALRLAPARETLAALEDEGMAGRFDLAFIDADKTQYLAYYESTLRLVRAGGLILVDNVLWGGDVVRDDAAGESVQAIRAFNRYVHADQRVDLSLLPVGDGLTLIRKRHESAASI